MPRASAVARAIVVLVNMANSSLLGYPSALSSTAYKLGKIAMVVTHQLGLDRNQVSQYYHGLRE
jgi:hypothetical protein